MPKKLINAVLGGAKYIAENLPDNSVIQTYDYAPVGSESVTLIAVSSNQASIDHLTTILGQLIKLNPNDEA